MTSTALERCDLHVHSIHSTDSGNFALRRARLGESYTTPERVYDTCLRRGMTLVTISDHNTLEGALRIAGRPGAFLSVEVTTRFPEDDVPLHVLVWNLSEEDHRDLQPYRPSVYELVDFLRERGLAHALAHPLYRMGPPLTVAHVERMMLLFRVWEGRNGARPEGSNVFAAALAASITPSWLEKLADRYGLTPRHAGPISLSAGSDDHGALDIATTWTQAAGATPAAFLEALESGRATIDGEHGSSVKLAHAVGALVLNAYRGSGRPLPAQVESALASLFDGDLDGADRHEQIVEATSAVARQLADGARRGAFHLDALPTLGHRLGALLLAGLIEAPFIGAVRHHAETTVGVRELEAGFFGFRPRRSEPRALVFTDTFDETNGVAGTMRRLATAAAAGEAALTVVSCGDALEAPGRIVFEPDWSVPVPAYESLELRAPSLTQVLGYVERARPDLIHVATPGPVGLCGLAAAKILGLPLVGSYHTELGPYALHLTRDLLVAEGMDRYVEAFYRQCRLVLGPTRAVAAAIELKGLAHRAGVWGRGVDADRFTPVRRDDGLRARLLAHGGDVLLLYVGRLSEEKRVHVLLDAFAELRRDHQGLRLVVAGDGPARETLEQAAAEGVVFAGELRGDELARLYASADVFCFPSTTDTFGQVILEAAASGLPVIAAAAGGATELVLDGRTGVLVAPDDAAALAAAISRLTRFPTRRLALGRAARAFALERTWERSLSELRAAYRLVADTEPGLQDLIAA